MLGMFVYCVSLTELDLSGFDTSRVTDMTSMFNFCSELTTIYVGDGWTTDKVTSTDSMFYDCEKLVGGNGTTYNEDYTDKTYARVDKEGEPGYFVQRPDGVLFPIASVWQQRVADLCSVAVGSNVQASIIMEDFTEIRFVSEPTDGYDNIGTLNAEGTIEVYIYIEDGGDNDEFVIEFVCAEQMYAPRNMSIFFINIDADEKITFPQNLTRVVFDNFDTSNTTDMSYMFYACGRLSALDLSGFDTGNVTNMAGMFLGCTSLNSLDLSTIKPGTVIIVEQPKPIKAFVYSNGEFIRFFDIY
jgi:surface protein